MEPAFREWWIPFGDSGYVVRYRAGDQSAVILPIRHGKEVGF
jgi:plasmid stabilization system protein ParE